MNENTRLLVRSYSDVSMRSWLQKVLKSPSIKFLTKGYNEELRNQRLSIKLIIEAKDHMFFYSI